MNFISRRHALKLTGGLAAATVFSPHIARATATKIRIGHNNTPTSIFHLACEAFKKHVAEKSDGRFEAIVFPSAQLGNEAQMVKAVSEGTLEATVGGISVLASLSPNVSVPEVPYIFKDTASARAAYDGKVGDYISNAMKDTGIAILGCGESGFRHVTAKKPIRTPDDLAGLKIRVQPAPIQVASFVGLGAAAEPLVFSELPEALRTGRFEAQENPIAIAVANEFVQKLQSHFNLTSHVYSPAMICFSQDILDEMSEDDQALMMAAAAAAVKETRAYSDELSAKGLGVLKAAGMTIVDDVDIGAFQKKMLSLNDSLAKIADLKAIEQVRGLIG